PKEKTSLVIDDDQGMVVSARVRLDSDGTGTLGWIRYDVGRHELLNTSANLDTPASLEFDKKWADRYEQCIGATTHQATEGSSSTYSNVRYDYSIDYPDTLLTPEEESPSLDGLVFQPKSGHADVRVWARTALDESLRDALLSDEQDDCAGATVAYEVSKLTYAAFSCMTPGHQIVYQKMVKRGDTLAAVRFEYDPAERSAWDAVIKKMANSLRLGPGTKYVEGQ
ncbi:hypothetical protein KCV01_g14974, partial [Aureobasidium melanogenum]